VRNEKGTRIVGGTDASKHEFPWQVTTFPFIKLWVRKYIFGGFDVENYIIDPIFSVSPYIVIALPTFLT
jgi:hypothetical protein